MHVAAAQASQQVNGGFSSETKHATLLIRLSLSMAMNFVSTSVKSTFFLAVPIYYSYPL
jgi:hypothetical protein